MKKVLLSLVLSLSIFVATTPANAVEGPPPMTTTVTVSDYMPPYTATPVQSDGADPIPPLM